MEDTARAPQPPTNKPTGHQAPGHQMNRQGLYVPRKAYFGAKMSVFGPNILMILIGSKSSTRKGKALFSGKIYTAEKKIYTTAGRDGRDKFQV